MTVHDPAEREIHGWARRPRRTARVSRGSAAGLMQASANQSAPCLPRGAGMSYGDASLGAHVLELAGDPVFELSPDHATARVGAGMDMWTLCEKTLAHGRFPAVLPGTRFATVGGCVAADVHAKNHRTVGSFGGQVEALEIWTADGARRTCTLTDDAELFRATIGGMGWTGLIDAVKLRLVETPGPWWSEGVTVGRNLDALLQLLDEAPAANHVVAWVDPRAKGPAIGRGFVKSGVPAEADSRHRAWPSAQVGFEPPVALLRPALVGALAEAIFARARWLERKGPRRVHYSRFFWPFDQLRGWNRLYGPEGFVSLQFVVPTEAASVLAWAIERAQSQDGGAYSGILKRFGAGSEGLLSFPMPGFSLALDLPSRPGVASLARAIHEEVARVGGRVYLAKDALLDRDCFGVMYPAAAEFREIKRRVDPNIRFSGDLAERLGLFEAR